MESSAIGRMKLSFPTGNEKLEEPVLENGPSTNELSLPPLQLEDDPKTNLLVESAKTIPFVKNKESEIFNGAFKDHFPESLLTFTF